MYRQCLQTLLPFLPPPGLGVCPLSRLLHRLLDRLLFSVRLLLLSHSRTVAVIVSVLINSVAAVFFLPIVEINSPLFLTILPGASTALFTTQSIVRGGVADELIRKALIWSLMSTVLYIVIAYVLMWLKEDLLNIMDRVSSNDLSDE